MNILSEKNLLLSRQFCAEVKFLLGPTGPCLAYPTVRPSPEGMEELAHLVSRFSITALFLVKR